VIVDIHGHYTTAPKALEVWRNRQIAGIKNAAEKPQVSELRIGDDEIRETIESNQLGQMRSRGSDLTIFSPRASFMALLALTRWWLFDASEDFAFAVLSAEVGVFLIGLPVLLAIRQHGSAPERPEDAWLPRVPTQGEGRDERALEGVDHSR
jgi:hypothetical protein